MGLAVLAGGLSFVGAAEATELITDGSLENTTPSSNPLVKLGGTANPGVGGGWSTFSTYLYSANYTMPGPAGLGAQYLRPYPSGTFGITQSSTNMTQLVSLTAATTLTPAKIDGGDGRYTVSAWFCTYRTDNDNSDLTLNFLDASNASVGSPIVLGGFDFVSLLPEADNGRYADAREWGQGSETGTIPVGARTAQIVIQSHSLAGAPDGYVDLISLDVVDAGVGTPTVASANPPDNAVSVGPVVNIGITLRDRSTAVNTNSIQLFLDSNLVLPTIQKVETNTIIQYAAGLLPALSTHTNRIVFSDDGTPVTTQTNQFRFTVADYLTLPASLGSPLGSEDTSKPGFNVSVYQVDTLVQTDPPNVQIDLPASLSFSEAVLAGFAGPNVANLTGAATSNTYEVPGVVNWITSFGATANFPNDEPFPGIPGTSGFEESFVHDVRTFVRFPTSGFYQMGINNEDQLRLTAAIAGIQTLQLVAPTNLTIPSVAIATNITQLQFGGSLPFTPLSAPVVYATPSGNPDDACLIGTNTSLAGKIVLLDRGATNCDSAFKAEQAQMAGAVAVLQTTPGDTGYPFRLNDINTNVRIPVLVIAENYGAALLKSYLTNGTPVTAVIRGDPNPRIAEWDGPKGFGAVDVNVGFAVPAAGVYPMRLVSGQEAGNADLEWFSIKSDGTKVLMNDTSNPDALRTFRARTVVQQPVFNAPTLAAGSVTISWTGNGTLQESTLVTGSWTNSPSQINPQTVPATTGNKFYRIQQ
jgi:hypothetical protein